MVEKIGKKKREVFCEALGRYISLPEKCERIVSFSPSITEALFDMGLGDKIKGVSVYCVRPESARKKVIVGSYSTCKYDKIREINPDLIFTTTGYQLDFAKKLAEEFPVYAVRLPLTLSDVISTVVEAGIVAGYEREARGLEIELLSALNRYTLEGRRIRVYVEIDLGGPTTFGAWSYITDTLHFVGLENIFGDEKREWLRPDDLKVKEKNPEVIIYEPKMFSKRRNEKEIFSMLKKRLGDVDAIKRNQVYITPGIYDFLAHHGPSLIREVIPWLRNVKERVENTLGK